MLLEVLLCVLGLIAFNFYKYYKVWRFSEKIPGPPALPFIGNTLQLGLNPVEYLETLLKWWRIYGCDIFRVWIGTKLFVLVTDPKDIESILSSTTLLKKSYLYDFLHPWLGEGLLTSYGQKWHKRRKIITPTFHFKILLDFLDVMNKGSSKLVQKLKEMSKSEKEFDVQRLIHLSTLDVICETAMGIEMNAMDDPESEVVKAYHDICYTMQNRFFDPLKQSDWTYKFLKDYKVQKKSLDILRTFTYEVIEKKRKSSSNVNHSNTSELASGDSTDYSNIKRRKAFLDTLMDATIDGKPLTLEEIAEEVSTFAFEGHDTTSSGISFGVYLLSRHTHIQQKIYEEQIGIFGDDTERDPTYQEIQDMKYLELFIKECQRIYPSVPMIARENLEDLNLNGRIIPANTNILLFILAMGQNEKVFKDPFKIDPERFSSDNREQCSPYEYVPFSAGPRNCIGQKFAMLEMKTILSKIVRNFEILHPTKSCDRNEIQAEHHANHILTEEPKHMWEGYHNRTHDPVLSAILTLQSDNGIDIRLRARHNN